MTATVDPNMSERQDNDTNAIESNEAWSNAAEGYKSSWAQYPLHCGRVALDKAHVQTGEKLLDVACGPGDLAIDAAVRKGACVDCIDFSEGMIEAVREKLGQLEKPASVTPHVMDGQNLQFSDSTFDVVVSSFGVMLFPDWKRGLAEMVRVTKPGGRIVVVVPGTDSQGQPGFSSIQIFSQVIESQFPEALPLPVPEGLPALGSEDLMRSALTSAGLLHPQATQVPFQLRMENPASMAQHLGTNPFTREVQKNIAEERRELLIPAFAEALAACMLPDGACGMLMSGVLGVAVKP